MAVPGEQKFLCISITQLHSAPGVGGWAYQCLAEAPILVAANLNTPSSNRSWPTTSDIRIQT